MLHILLSKEISFVPPILILCIKFKYFHTMYLRSSGMVGAELGTCEGLFRPVRPLNWLSLVFGAPKRSPCDVYDTRDV
jgi:hypothetical protein